jgi:hypothetical protein
MEIFKNTISTTRILQQKHGKVPNNTESTTKLSYIRELAEILARQSVTLTKEI